MSTVVRDPVHALEISTDNLPLLLPSACLAEVVALPRLTHVPQAPPWLLGVFGWRLRPVPVVSYDMLAGGEGHTQQRQRMVKVVLHTGFEAGFEARFVGEIGGEAVGGECTQRHA